MFELFDGFSQSLRSGHGRGEAENDRQKPSYSLGVGFQTAVNIRPGQTLVLGSSPLSGSTTTLLLAVRAEDAG